MLSNIQLKEITKGSRQSLFWSRKIAEAQEKETSLKIIRYIEQNLLPETSEANQVWWELRNQILDGTYIDLDKVK